MLYWGDIVEKRIELHCHTEKSQMNASSSPKEIIEYANEIGLGGIAITDYCSTQAFKEAAVCCAELDNDDFKLIYGMEAYLVDDEYGIVYNDKGNLLENNYVAIDIETTGFSSEKDRIIEIAAVKFDSRGKKENFHTLVNPEMVIPEFISELCGISNETVQDSPNIQTIMPQLIEFCNGSVIVAHEAEFDMKFLCEAVKRMNMKWDVTYVDTKALSELLLHECKKFSLESVARYLQIELLGYASLDAVNTVVEIFLKLQRILSEKGIRKLSEIKKLAVGNAEYVKKKAFSHATILVQNQDGMENLNKLINESHNRFYGKKPVVPKSLLSKYKAGLFIGSGCVSGEVFQALVNGDTEEEIERIQQFYDYFEIQPVSNNHFMISSPQYDTVNTEEDLENFNRKIVELGKKYNKLVIADGYVHYTKKEDFNKAVELFKKRGFIDPVLADSLYLHNAEEMVKEFLYLGADIADDVVMRNPRYLLELISYVNIIEH